MITALTVKRIRPCGIRERFRAVFSPYEIKVKHIQDKFLGLNMLHITYIQKDSAVRFKKIKRAVHAGFTETLCAYNVTLPRSLGFKRFESTEYSCQLCINAAEEYIRQLDAEPDELRISLYDLTGRFVNAAERLARYTKSLKIATKAISLYEAENERLMREYGAALLVRDRLGEILPCDILVAPQTITEPLSVTSGTAVFTGSPPKVSVGGIVYDRFEVPLPACFKEIKPEELSNTYFLSALYSLEKMKWLGGLCPSASHGGVPPPERREVVF